MGAGRLIVADSNLHKGRLLVSNGSKFLGNSWGLIGLGENSLGEVTISGVGSEWQATWIYVGGTDPDLGDDGGFRQGILNINDAGTVKSSFSYLGPLENSTGTVSISGTNSTMETSYVDVGYLGQGYLNVVAGGQLSAAHAIIGTKTGSTGVVTISEESSLWESASLRIGEYGVGVLNVTQGGAITTGRGTLGRFSGSSGEATISGSTSIWESEHIAIGGDSSLGSGGLGKLTVEAGGTIRISNNETNPLAQGVYVFETGAIMGDHGTIEGNVFSKGVVAPGSSSGILNIDGDLHNTGVIELEISGSSNFDLLNISGTLTAGGTIKVSLSDSYSPQLNDSFGLLRFSKFVDAGYIFDFAAAELADPRWKWDTSDFLRNGTISVISVPEPGSLALILISMAGISWARRLRHI